MAKAVARGQIKLKSTDPASAHCYYTTKNKRNTPDRLVLKKYDPTVKRHVEFKEEK